MKWCKGCDQFLPLEQFSMKRVAKDGKQPLCKQCDNLQKKLWYKKNLARERIKRAKWQEENHDLLYIHLLRQKDISHHISHRNYIYPIQSQFQLLILF